ncbi:MAG: hypothetical protein QOF67_258 [Mycobacterium sp.]|nr:hypothetical protein [Mycobacterium sp.]
MGDSARTRWTPRLQDPNDLVRTEVQRALDRDDVLVIPVLVDGARMPDADELPLEMAELDRLNAFELTDKSSDYDINDLCRQMLREGFASPRRLLAIGAAVAAVAIGAGAVTLITGQGSRATVREAVGESEAVAHGLIRGRDLNVSKVTHICAVEKRGTVLHQTPPAEKVVNPGRLCR